MAENKEKSPPIKRCFVVGPIGAAGSEPRKHADWLLEEIIRPVLRDHFKDYEVNRADEMAEPGLITTQMINALLDSELVIADMSLHNPNAFYEIGIRHMVQKPIIHMFLGGTDIPFDVKAYRSVCFGYSNPSELRAARADLKKAIEATTVAGFKVENPVTAARGKMEIEIHGTPEIKLLSDRIDTLESKFADGFAKLPGEITEKFEITFKNEFEGKKILVAVDKLVKLLGDKYGSATVGFRNGEAENTLVAIVTYFGSSYEVFRKDFVYRLIELSGVISMTSEIDN